jgi:hypothetical protein
MKFVVILHIYVYLFLNIQAAQLHEQKTQLEVAFHQRLTPAGINSSRILSLKNYAPGTCFLLHNSHSSLPTPHS